MGLNISLKHSRKSLAPRQNEITNLADRIVDIEAM